jgi:spore maturation protein CgeB
MHSRKIKIIRASTYYPSALERFCTGNQELNDLSYLERYRFVMNECFAQSDFWKKNLEETQQYEVQEVVLNADFLQKQWAKENNITFDQNNWELDILKKQILYYKPDILICFDLKHITPEFRYAIKKILPELKLIISWDGALLHSLDRLKGSDVVLSCVPETVDFYNKNGIKSFFYPHCFEPSVLDKISKKASLYDISFVGSIFLNNDFHYSRFKAIQEIDKEVDMKLWISSLTSPFKNFCLNSYYLLKKLRINDYFQMHKISGKSKGNIFGRDMYQVLSDSKVTLNFLLPDRNVYGTNSGANMRLFEATGVGACLVSDREDIVRKYFEPDTEIITYKTTDECVEKVKYLLNNDKGREQISKAGQARVLKDHTYKKRLDDLMPEIINLLNG